MADWLLLRLPRTPEQEYSWILADSHGAALSAPDGGALESAASLAPGRRVCVLVPGTDVLLANPELPAKAGVKLQQIVPYALEEQLADDIDSSAFCGRQARSGVARRRRSPSYHVRCIESWLAQLGRRRHQARAPARRQRAAA